MPRPVRFRFRQMRRAECQQPAQERCSWQPSTRRHSGAAIWCVEYKCSPVGQMCVTAPAVLALHRVPTGSTHHARGSEYQNHSSSVRRLLRPGWWKRWRRRRPALPPAPPWPRLCLSARPRCVLPRRQRWRWQGRRRRGSRTSGGPAAKHRRLQSFGNRSSAETSHDLDQVDN